MHYFMMFCPTQKDLFYLSSSYIDKARVLFFVILFPFDIYDACGIIRDLYNKKPLSTNNI